MKYQIGQKGYLGTIEITNREKTLIEIGKYEDRINYELLGFPSNKMLQKIAEKRIKKYETVIKELILFFNNNK